MLDADAYADALVNTFSGTRHEAEAKELARLIADSAVDASILQRGAHRSTRSEESAEAARAERQRAEKVVQLWFAEAGQTQDS